MRALWQSEWYKLRKTKVLYLAVSVLVLALLLGYVVDSNLFADSKVNQWKVLFTLMNGLYGLLLLPLLTGVVAGFICRYEHQAGGWKQLLALPVTRGKVFIAKYTVILAMVFGVQFLYGISIYLIGLFKGYTDPFPLEMLCKSLFGGWVALFPLVALQLLVSIIWKSFAAPMVVNVCFTLPSLLVVNSERFGPFYPWTQPFWMMDPINGKESWLFFISWEQFFLVVGSSFVVFFGLGLLTFYRKAI